MTKRFSLVANAYVERIHGNESQAPDLAPAYLEMMLEEEYSARVRAEALLSAAQEALAKAENNAALRAASDATKFADDMKQAREREDNLRAQIEAVTRDAQLANVEMTRLKSEQAAALEAKDEAVRARKEAEQNLKTFIERPAPIVNPVLSAQDPVSYEIDVTVRDAGDKLRKLVITPMKKDT